MRKPQHEMDERTDLLQRLGYEPRDIDLRTIVIWLAGLFIGGGVTAVITYGVYLLFVAQEVKPGTGTQLVNVRKLPPEGYPRIQAHPKQEIGDFRHEEDDRVYNYAWKDKQKGIVRIPVDRAMDLVLQKGLPTRASAPPDYGSRPANASPSDQAR